MLVWVVVCCGRQQPSSWNIGLAVLCSSFAASKSAARTRHRSNYVSSSDVVADVRDRIEFALWIL